MEGHYENNYAKWTAAEHKKSRLNVPSRGDRADESKGGMCNASI